MMQSGRLYDIRLIIIPNHAPQPLQDSYRSDINYAEEKLKKNKADRIVYLLYSYSSYTDT